MKTILRSALLLIILIVTATFVKGQQYDKKARIWGVYASGVGGKLKRGMNPCWVTYTVAAMSNPRIRANVKYGTMGIVGRRLTWAEANARKRRFSRYFGDAPDGIYKLRSCEVPPISVTGVYSTKWGIVKLRQSGSTVTGTYYDGKARISGSIKGNVLRGTWTQRNNKSGQLIFTFSNSGSSFNGKWKYDGKSHWYNDWSGTRRKSTRRKN